MEQGSEHTCEYCEEVKKRNKDYIQCGKCEHFVALNGWRYHQESCLSQKELHYLTE